MKSVKIVISFLATLFIITSSLTLNAFAADRTADGMANWAINAYSENWSYTYGGATSTGVDCSGLIYSYAGSSRTTESLFAESPNKGSVSSIPEVPGLGVYMPGHVGVYIGNGMVIDARNEEMGICLSSIKSTGWTYWFEIKGVSYN